MTANWVDQAVDHLVAGANTFPDVAHVALTVTDLDRSVDWYRELFGTDPVKVHDGDPIRAAVWAFPAVVLHEFVHHTGTESFDELRPGLDHLAFQCGDRDEVEVWAGRLDALGVAHSEIVEAPYGSGLSFRDPDNIALEFFAPPPTVHRPLQRSESTHD